ncbi:Krueppel-like factor 13 isoform X12 [Agelaius tricolor]|uniref:Krueppel-like factor 13 isoform X12 n=1 Tax=Agelaius tricolor TaxID=9191 RepID=UPI0039F1B1C5
MNSPIPRLSAAPRPPAGNMQDPGKDLPAHTAPRAAPPAPPRPPGRPARQRGAPAAPPPPARPRQRPQEEEDEKEEEHEEQDESRRGRGRQEIIRKHMLHFIINLQGILKQTHNYSQMLQAGNGTQLWTYSCSQPGSHQQGFQRLH